MSVGVQGVWRVSSESPTTLVELHDDGLVLPARCESLIAIRSRNSRSVMRRHKDGQLRGIVSCLRSGCSPLTLGESGAIAATYPLTASFS